MVTVAIHTLIPNQSNVINSPLGETLPNHRNQLKKVRSRTNNSHGKIMTK